jgi:hypothetical protein
MHDCGWNLAESEEEALKAARAWAEETDRRRHHGYRFVTALDDIRRIIDPTGEPT